MMLLNLNRLVENAVPENTVQDNTALQEELLGLLARCALRDRIALQRLYEHTAGYLNAVAFRILRSEDASNDVLQEAFLQIWDKAGSYRADQAKPMTWMASIVRYRALDRLDHEKYHQRHLLDHDVNDLSDELSHDDNPEKQMAATQQQRYLRDCLTQLNQRVAHSINLAYLHGFSREEIAEQLQTNVNTVKSWLHRGAEALRHCLEGKHS